MHKKICNILQIFAITSVSIENSQFLSVWMTFVHLNTNCKKFAYLSNRVIIATTHRFTGFLYQNFRFNCKGELHQGLKVKKKLNNTLNFKSAGAEGTKGGFPLIAEITRRQFFQ